MKCSFIVSAFDRPLHLACLLCALQLQTEPDFEVIVTDNAKNPDFAGANARIVRNMLDERMIYEPAGQLDCYLSANWGTGLAQGDYLCFPSDDNYYVPRFLEEMLKGSADLIYCDCVYDGYGIKYSPMNVAPECGRIDKGGFLVRREKFSGFEGTPGTGRPADGWLVEKLVRDGVSHAKVPGYLWVHN